MITLDQGGAARGRVELARPGPGESHLAELVWTQETGGRPGSAWRIVPDTHPHLLLHRFEDGRSAVLFVGPRSRHIDISQETRRFTVGVRLRPGALTALLGVSSWSLRDGAVPAGDVLAARLRPLLDRIGDAPDAGTARTLLLEALRRSDSGRDIDWRVRGFGALVAGGVGGRGRPDSVRDVALRLGISERALREAYRRELGLRPKEAQRIARLHRAIGATLQGVPDTIAAVRSGYVDQSHLIRECRVLLGATPRAFRARATPPAAGAAPASDR